MKGCKWDACFELSNVSFTWKINIAESCLLKGKFMRLVGALSDQTIDVFSDEAKTVILKSVPNLFLFWIFPALYTQKLFSAVLCFTCTFKFCMYALYFSGAPFSEVLYIS